MLPNGKAWALKNFLENSENVTSKVIELVRVGALDGRDALGVLLAESPNNEPPVSEETDSESTVDTTFEQIYRS